MNDILGKCFCAQRRICKETGFYLVFIFLHMDRMRECTGCSLPIPYSFHTQQYTDQTK